MSIEIEGLVHTGDFETAISLIDTWSKTPTCVGDSTPLVIRASIELQLFMAFTMHFKQTGDKAAYAQAEAKKSMVEKFYETAMKLEENCVEVC